MHSSVIFWLVFAVIVIILFTIDLYLTDHRNGKISIKTSLIWSGVWITSALVFNLFIFFFVDNGSVKSVEFLTGYIIEKSLSIDNLFVFYMIFNLMNVKNENQPRVLKWGIISAIILRVVFILFGVALIQIFHPIIYVFGGILLFAAYKMAFGDDTPIDFESNSIIKYITSRFNLLSENNSNHFFKRINGKIFITNLFLTLILIESADVIFAIDSIPAVIAITHDPFIIITSNIFAILGLRALYFALAGLVELFTYIKYGVSLILLFVGLKMMLSDILPIPTTYSLVIISTFLIGAILISILMNHLDNKQNKKLNKVKYG